MKKPTTDEYDNSANALPIQKFLPLALLVACGDAGDWIGHTVPLAP